MCSSRCILTFNAHCCCSVSNSAQLHSARRKRARPSSIASRSACRLQSCVRRANLANCFASVCGGPFWKNSKDGARSNRISWRRVARDSITYKSNHQSSSSFGCAPPSCLPQSMITPSRIVLPWQAVDVTARAWEIRKPVLVTV